jgi:general secretion pathway protein D
MEGMHVGRPGIVFLIFLQFCLLAGCSSAVQKYFSSHDSSHEGARDEPNPTITAVHNADLSAHSPLASDDRSDSQSDQSPKPLLFPGTETEFPAPAPRGPASSELRTASLEPVVVRGDGIEINFEGADIQSVAKVLLGDTLHLNFVVDPKVQGTVTLASAGPIPRKDVLPTLESVLRMQNAAIVQNGKIVKIVPVADASGQSPVSAGIGEPGFGVSVVPLHYVSATTIAKTAENMLARQGAIRVDQSRNLLLIQGTAPEREAALDMISTFDVEWLRNQSVGVYPLKSTSPETMIEELERVFETREGGAGNGVVHFQPVSRMNAVMVVTKNPELLKQTTQWVERLDRSDNSGTAVRSYRLKYGNAAQIAKILNNIFVNESGTGNGNTPANQIAPGTTTAQSRLDSLTGTHNSGTGAGTTTIGSSTGSVSGQSGGSFGAGSSGGTPLAAAFKSFSNHGDADGSGGGGFGGAPSGGSAQKGMFENVRITADTINNAVVVYSNQEDYRIIERAVHDFDRPRLQVSIDATVAEVTLTKELSYGVQYYFNGKQGSIGLTNAVTAAAGTSAAGATLLQQTFPGFNAVLGSTSSPKVILNALNSITDVKVLSSPSIVALDNQPAILEVGDEIPISTGTSTILTAANPTTVNTIQMQPTGIILKVLPHVNANGSIELEVDQEVSAVVNPSSGTVNLTPTISQRHIHSTVAVNSGQTVLLGGLISDNDQKSNNSLPGLGDINVLGTLLGNTDNTKTRTEIIIFIRPLLIRNAVSARAVTQEFRDRLTSMKSNSSSVVNGADVHR